MDVDRPVTRGRRLLGVGLLVIVTPAGAQDVSHYRERADRLYERLVEMGRAADRAREARSLEREVDTIRVGALVLLADPEDSLVTPAAASRVESVLRVTLGAKTSLLDDVVFYPVVRPRWDERVRRRLGPPRMAGRELEPFGVDRATVDEMTIRLHSAAEHWVGRTLDPVVDRWLRQSVPIRRDSVSLERTYEEFMTGFSPLVADCATGDDAACWVALGVTPVDDPLMQWYDADARRALVASSPGIRRSDPEAARVCVERRWDAVCVSLLDRLTTVPIPFSLTVRMDLLRYALARGGERSFERLFALSSLKDSMLGIAGVLEVAAGMPVDSLLDGWRAAVHDAAPPLVTLSVRTAVASLVWVGIFVAVALRNRPVE